MQIIVSGKHIDVGEALRTHAEEKLEKSVTKFFDRAINAHITFSKHNNRFFKCVIVVNVGIHLIIEADGDSDDAYASFDISLARIEKQLRKYKRKIKDHHKKTYADLSDEEKSLLVDGTKYILSTEHEHDEHDNPIIIEEKPITVQHLTVSEAVMKMDLANVPALMFVNKADGKYNIVYYRRDGNISWVEPK